MMFTILGATGFIGRHLVQFLRQREILCYLPNREDPQLFSRPLGHVIYCAGCTANFRYRILETVDAHVCLLHRLIKEAQFDSLLYLSSTRVYQRALHAIEETFLPVCSSDTSDLYNISKLMGESLCISVGRPEIRIVRLSNVYGCGMSKENFLGSLIDDALYRKQICLKTTLDSCKDYICINDIPPILTAIALQGSYQIYNVAAGYNTSHEQLINQLVELTGCRVTVDSQAQHSFFPVINIQRIQKEFDFKPTILECELPKIIQSSSDKLELNSQLS